jgi:hypothetical protein
MTEMATAKFRMANAVLLFPLLLTGGPARAQDPLQTLPKNYRLVFENICESNIRANFG